MMKLPLQLIAILSSLLLVVVVVTAEELEPIGGGGVSMADFSQEKSSFQRIHNGKENNADFRAEIRKMEAESPLFKRNGVPDPNHEVGYNLDKHHLSTNSSSRRLNDYVDPRTSSEPLRITFATETLDSRATDAENSAKVNFIKSKILPKVKEFWSDALSVAPVVGPLKVSTAYLAFGAYCGDPTLPKVPSEHITDGVDDTDLILYVSGLDCEPLFGAAGAIAFALGCNIDQFDRPTAGTINMCFDAIALDQGGTGSDDDIANFVNVVIHEVAHVLGMSSDAMKFFWDPDTKKPRTPRPFVEKSVKCVNGDTQTIAIPNENTVEFITDPINGRRSAFVVTPKVRTVARNQFNCADLEGAQLENIPTATQDCLGSHWDERYFLTETLSAVISSSTMVLSPLTLALFEDSGWYFANYKNSVLSPFGHGAGCDFVRKPCLVQDESGQTSVPDYGRGSFCSVPSTAGCSPSNHFKMACSLIDFSLYAEVLDGPPPAFQYFSDPNLGGLPQTDYCPVYELPYANKDGSELDCRDPQNSDDIVTPDFGEVFGSESMCFENSVGYPICYKHKCDSDARKLSIYVLNQEFECEEDFQEITPLLLVATEFKIVCPRLATACPDMFCPLNCEARGNCNWDAPGGPKCECFDASDTSESCSKNNPLAGPSSIPSTAAPTKSPISLPTTTESGDNHNTSSSGYFDLKTSYWLKKVVLMAAVAAYMML